MSRQTTKLSTPILGALVLSGMSLSSATFAMQPLEAGYNKTSSSPALATNELPKPDCSEGRCGEGMCGEGKCGEGKCGQGKCHQDAKTGESAEKTPPNEKEDSPSPQTHT